MCRKTIKIILSHILLEKIAHKSYFAGVRSIFEGRSRYPSGRNHPRIVENDFFFFMLVISSDNNLIKIFFGGFSTSFPNALPKCQVQTLRKFFVLEKANLNFIITNQFYRTLCARAIVTRAD